MNGKAVSGMILMLLLISVISSVLIIQPVESERRNLPPPPKQGEVGYPAQPTVFTLQGQVNPLCAPDVSGSESSSHYWVGAMTSQRNQGIMASIQVTDPDVQRATADYFAAWVMEHQYGPDLGISVGWGEVGWRDDKQYIWAYDTQYNEWFFYDQYSISPGDWITVALTYQEGTEWAAWLWDYSNNDWILLHVADVGFSSPQYTSQFGDVEAADGSEFYVPDTSFQDTSLLITESWNLWDTGYTTYEYNPDPPYDAHWLSKYWHWYMHGGESTRLSIYTDKYTYHYGDIMHLGLNVTNRDSVKYLCLRIWIALPDSSIYPYMHEHSVTLAIGLDYTNPTFQSIKLPELQPGQYTWHAAFLERATHTIIVEARAHSWLVEVAPTRVQGIDVSHHQGEIDWNSVYDAGYRFAFVKASEGIGWEDRKFEQNVENARKAGFFVGAYHYARPVDNDGNLRNEAADEARWFVEVASKYFKAGYLRPALDLEDTVIPEKSVYEYPYKLGKEALSNWIHEWMETVKKETGIEPILCVNSNYANEYLDFSVAQYDLWIAHWTYDPSTTPDTGIWDTWGFWQYSDNGSVPGIGGPVDLDLFNGDMHRLYDLFVIRSPISVRAQRNEESHISNSF